jgi:CBS domain containing-hemolysin-like protein
MEENLKVMRETPYSRYPVLRRSDKDVLGVMEIKDLMASAIEGSRWTCSSRSTRRCSCPSRRRR